MALHLFRYNVTNLNGEEPSMALRTKSGTNYEVFGSVKDPAVVFVHGLGLDLNTWEKISPYFSDDYRVVLYDLNGHGKSDASIATQTLSLFAEQLADLLDELEKLNKKYVLLSNAPRPNFSVKKFLIKISGD